MVAISSLQDWVVGTGIRLLEGVIADPAKAPEDLPKVLAMWFSSAKAGLDLQTSHSNLLFNTVLRRRDSALSTASKDMTDIQKSTLRQHSLSDPVHLFDDDTCAAVHKQMLDRAQHVLAGDAASQVSRRQQPAAQSGKPRSPGKPKPVPQPSPARARPQHDRNNPLKSPAKGKTGKGGRAGRRQ